MVGIEIAQHHRSGAARKAVRVKKILSGILTGRSDERAINISDGNGSERAGRAQANRNCIRVKVNAGDRRREALKLDTLPDEGKDSTETSGPRGVRSGDPVESQ